MELHQRAEIHINGAWVKLGAGVVRADPGVQIIRGRQNEQGRVGPTSCSMTLNDQTGKFNTLNPNSEYFGQLGPNTQLRFSVGTEPPLEENFNRSATDAWTGGTFPWTNSGGAASDYDINGTKGTHTHTSTNVLRFSRVNLGQRDQRIRTVVNLSAATLTGAAVSAHPAVRLSDVNNYYCAILSYSTSDIITLGLFKRVGGSLAAVGTAGAVLIGATTNYSTSQIVVEVAVQGNRLMANAWGATAAEPTGWLLYETDDSLTSGDEAALVDRRETGNTDANLQFQYDSFLAIPGSIRATVEVPGFGASRWSTGQRDVHMPILGSGIKRRLGSGGSSKPAKSPMRQFLEASAPFSDAPVAAWTLEGGELVTAAEPLYGRHSMRPFTGTHPSGAVVSYPRWGQGSLGPSYPPVLSRSGAGGLTIIWAPVLMPDFTNTWTVDMVWASGTEPGAGDIAATVDINPSYLGGSLGWPQLLFVPGVQELKVAMNSEPEVTAVIAKLYDGNPHHVRLTATQSGGNVAWVARVDGVSVNAGTTAGAMTLPAISSLALTAVASSAIAQGYVSVHTLAPAIADAVDAALGFVGESAGARFARLCEQLGIAYKLIGDAADTARMGPQRYATIPANLEDVEDADGGIMYEPREFLGLAYRTAADLCNQSGPALDYEARHLIGEPFPNPGDLGLANDVTAQRTNGGQFSAVQETGPNNVQAPEDDPDGVGRYERAAGGNVESDGQLPDIAGFARHLNTWPGPRYPTITVEMNRLQSDPALAARMANLDIGDYFSIDNPPAWLPPDPIEVLNQGEGETVRSTTWEITRNTVPAGPYVVGVRGTTVRDTLASELGSSATTTATSLSVAVTSGPLWTTGAVSFNVMIGGELIPVTNISGATSPQTFTVTRSANGVVKAHNAGAPLTVWPRPRRALAGPGVAGGLDDGTFVRGLDNPAIGRPEIFSVTVTSVPYLADSTPYGATFVAPSHGAVVVHQAANLDNSGAERTYQTYEIREGATIGEGTIVVAAGDERAIMSLGADAMKFGRTRIESGLTPGKIYNVSLKVRVSGGTGTLFRRLLLVRPAGVGSGSGLPGTVIDGSDGGTGTIASDTEDALDTSTSPTFTAADMAVCGTAFTAPTSGRIYVHLSAHIDNSAANTGVVSYRIGTGSTVGAGTEVVAAADGRSLTRTNVNQVMFGRTFVASGLTPGSAYNIQLMHRTTAGTVELIYRNVGVEPL